MNDEFNPADFDAFEPPAQDEGVAEFRALTADIRQGIARMSADANRMVSMLIDFETRAAARDRVIADRLVDPEELERRVVAGAIAGGQALAERSATAMLATVKPLAATLEKDRREREDLMKTLAYRQNGLERDWWQRLRLWQAMAAGVILGLIVGAGGMVVLNRGAETAAFQKGVTSDRAFLTQEDMLNAKGKAHMAGK